MNGFEKITGNFLLIHGRGDREAYTGGMTVTMSRREDQRAILEVYHYGDDLRLIGSRQYDIGGWVGNSVTGEYQYLLNEAGTFVQYYIDHSGQPGIGMVTLKR